MSKEQGSTFKEELDELKVTLRIENEKYLRAHPELKYLTQLFLESALDAQPKDIVLFASKFFERPDLRRIVQQKQIGAKE